MSPGVEQIPAADSIMEKAVRHKIWNLVHKDKTLNKNLMILPFVLYSILVIIWISTSQPWCDEAWFASSSVNLTRNGFMGCTNLIPSSVTSFSAANLERYTYWQPPLYFLTEALAFKLLGVGLLQARLLSAFWGLLGMIAVYFLARYAFHDKRELIFLSMLLIATNWFYLLSASDARMDMMASSLALIGLSLYLTLRTCHIDWALFLGNLFMCLSGLTHPNGLIGLLILVFLVVVLDRKNFNFARVIIILSPYVLGALGWGTYILQDFASFKSQFFGNVIRSHGWSWSLVYRELVQRYFENFGSIGQKIRAPIFLVLFLGFIAAPFRLKNKENKILWCMLLIDFLGLMFISGNKTPGYLVWINAFFVINAVWLWNDLKKIKIIKRISLGVFAYIFSASFFFSVIYLIRNPYQNVYKDDLINFRDNYYKGGQIYGSAELSFFYDFDDATIQDDRTLGFTSGIEPDYFVVEAFYQRYFKEFEKTRPDLWKHISKTLSEDYHIVLQGKYYSFYERKKFEGISW